MRKLLLSCAAALQLCCLRVPAQPAVYSGVFAFGSGDLNTLAKQDTITNFVSDAQKDVSIINMFNSWTSGASTNGTVSFPTTAMNYIRGHGSMPLFSWQPQNSSLGVTQSFTLANITNGVYDTYITNWATAARNWAHPFFLRLAHEMNGNWYPWCAGVNGNTAGQYVDMWRHVHDLFTGVGATNVTWVWCVNTVFSTSTPIDQLYPGDNYVDWISVDGYNRLANSWQDFSAVAAATITQLTNIAPGKPIMVAETGCNQNTNFDKAKWFRNALTNYLPLVQPRIKAWVYFNSTNSNDGNEWRINVPASAQSGYRDGIGLMYYATNQYGSISSTPIQPLISDMTAGDTMAPFVSIVSPPTCQVTNGTAVKFLALASDKSGISKVVYLVNGVAQQTNISAPYQFFWTVPVQPAQTYTVKATAYDNAGNSAPSTVYMVSQGATNILQTTSESSPMDWNSAIWGTPAAPPVPASNYETPNGFAVRTPNINTGANPGSFAGNSLQIDAGGVLYLKHNNVGETVNLILDGGEIRYHGAPGGTNSPLAGTLQVAASSTITSDQTGGAGTPNVNIWLLSSVTGSGNLTAAQDTATNGLVLLGNNGAYSGNWTNSGGFIQIGSGTTNPLGSGAVTLVNSANYLDFNSTNDLVINNVIRGGGSVVKRNSGSVTLTADNTFTGNLTISAGTLTLVGSVANTARIGLSSGAVLDVAAVSGGFVINGPQTLSGIGTVSGDVHIAGTIAPGPLGTLNFNDDIVLSGATVMEVNRTNVPAADLIIAPTVAFGGTLSVTNPGPVLQAGDSFQLFTGTINGVFAVTNLPALSSNLTWDASKLNTQGMIAVALKSAVPPVILPPVWDGANLRLQVNSQEGFSYVLQATPELAPANWTPIQTNAGGGLLTFIIPTNASAQQFFRISVQ